MSSAATKARQELLPTLGDWLRIARPRKYERGKIVHDAIWGTTWYEPWEMGLLDLPIFQRLRGIKQTGFAYLTYPASEHSRFQHILGVVHAATRVFDSLKRRAQGDGLSVGARQAVGDQGFPELSDVDIANRNQVLLRLAALVHDLGHSMLSHTSERLFALLDPFPELRDDFRATFDKKPGAAEIMVYLLVTSDEWYKLAADIWSRCNGPGDPPQPEEWQQIGRWVMGIEPETSKKFLCDIISGPIDADKLDYIARDAYFAGLPIAQDLDRFLSTVCVDFQEDKQSNKGWYRLTLPLHRGINALEQLVMSRLVLFSYLYHHQKVRAAEVFFERQLAREFLDSGKQNFARVDSVWDLFAIQDAHLYHLTSGRPHAWPPADIAYRVLPRRVAEFREQDVTRGAEKKARANKSFRILSRRGRPKSWQAYQEQIDYEDGLAKKAGLPAGSVIMDFPNNPSYGDLEDLLLPGRDPDVQTTAADHLSYADWVEAYNKHRVFVRVFALGDEEELQKVWIALKEDFAANGLSLGSRLCLLK